MLARTAQHASRFGCAAGTPGHAYLRAPETAGRDGSYADPQAKIVAVRRGVAELSGARGRWSIMPGHMVFVPAGRPYVFATAPDTVAAVVHLPQDEVAWTHDGRGVAPVPPLAAEMISRALSWGPDRPAGDPTANAFFTAIARICPEWFSGSRILWTPFPKSPERSRAMAFARTHLDTASIEATARAAHLSVRTLRRRFQHELGLPWWDFMREIRMNRAMELLSREHLSVTQTAYAVGFNSVGAFTVAFSAYAGRPPSTFSPRRGQARTQPSSITSGT